MKTINLLPKIAEEEIKKGIYRIRVNVFSTIILVVMLLFVLGVFTFRNIQLNSLDNLKKSSNEEESSILTNQFKEVILRTVNLKLSKIASLLNNSPKYSEYVADINSLGGGVILTDLKIEGKTVSLSLLSGNSDSLTVFLNNLIDPNFGAKKFKNVSLSSLTYSSKDTVYKMSLKMEAMK